MRKLINLVKWGAVLGKEPQNFLGAKWVQGFLGRVPNAKKRIWALRLLSLSPHYFINTDDPKYKNLSSDEYLETVFKECLESRAKIYDQILKRHLTASAVALDYGCGPGFLAKSVAPHVRQVYACDISDGALACARVLNGAPNVDYVTADEAGLAGVPDETVDVVYSFALIQHLTDEIYELVLDNCRKKLKPGGKLILHVQLEDPLWRTEEQWKADKSLQGKIKYRYGLHCFARTEASHRETVAGRGFEVIEVKNMADLTSENFDDVCSQQLLTARKK